MIIITLFCAVCLELPSLLPVAQLSEALLRLKKASYFICKLLGNMPGSFDKGFVAALKFSLDHFSFCSVDVLGLKWRDFRRDVTQWQTKVKGHPSIISYAPPNVSTCSMVCLHQPKAPNSNAVHSLGSGKAE